MMDAEVAHAAAGSLLFLAIMAVLLYRAWNKHMNDKLKAQIERLNAAADKAKMTIASLESQVRDANFHISQLEGRLAGEVELSAALDLISEKLEAAGQAPNEPVQQPVAAE